MANSAEVISVSTNIQDSSPKITNFGALAVLAYHTNFPEMREYAADADGLSAMVTDGFDTKHQAYKHVAAAAAQNPGPATVKVYNRATPNVQVKKLIPVNLVEGAQYRFNVHGTEVTRTVAAGTDTATEVTALHADINAISGVTATDEATHVEITPTDSEVLIDIKAYDGSITVEDTSADAGIATDLANAVLENPGFFGFAIDSTSSAEILAAFSWADSNKRLFAATSNDYDIWTSATDDVLSDLKGLSRVFGYLLPTRDGEGKGAFGLMARQFTQDPAASNWAFKKITGALADSFTPAQIGFIRAKNGLAYVPIEDLPLTLDGKSPGGRYLDLTRGIAWVEAQLKAAIIITLANLPKVPFNQGGLDAIEATIRGVLIAAETNVFNPGSTGVTMPKLAAISTADKIARSLKGIRWKGVAQGAVNDVAVNGDVTI